MGAYAQRIVKVTVRCHAALKSEHVQQHVFGLVKHTVLYVTCPIFLTLKFCYHINIEANLLVCGNCCTLPFLFRFGGVKMGQLMTGLLVMSSLIPKGE